MRSFTYDRATSLAQASQSLRSGERADGTSVQGRYPAEYLAGGTTLIDLMKLDVMQPARVVDLSGLTAANADISLSQTELKL